MARKNAVIESELALARRLRDLRAHSKLSRVDLAQELGVDPGTLESYESGRVPLRYGVGTLICRRFDVNQRWLATGKPPKAGFIPVGADMVGYERQSFLSVFESKLAAKFDAQIHSMEWAARAGAANVWAHDPSAVEWPPIGASYRDVLAISLRAHLQPVMDALPEDELSLFLATILQFARQFAQNKSLAGRESSITLDKGTGSKETPPGMTENVLPGLLVQVRQLVKPRGMQTWLANKLGVSRQAVSNWLAGTAMPSAEMALRLDAWVKQAGVKLKCPAAADTATGQTPKRKPIHDKPSPEPSGAWPKKSKRARK